MGGKLTARHRHASDDGGNRNGPLRAVEAQGLELPIQPDLAQCLQGDVLDGHTPGSHQFQTIDIAALVITGLCRSALIQASPSANDLRGIALRRLFPVRLQVRRHPLVLARNELLDALCQRRPLLARHLEMPSQVEQCPLANALLGANRFHQPKGVVRLTGASALDGALADESVRRP